MYYIFNVLFVNENWNSIIRNWNEAKRLNALPTACIMYPQLSRTNTNQNKKEIRTKLKHKDPFDNNKNRANRITEHQTNFDCFCVCVWVRRTMYPKLVVWWTRVPFEIHFLLTNLVCHLQWRGFMYRSTIFLHLHTIFIWIIIVWNS